MFCNKSCSVGVDTTAEYGTVLDAAESNSASLYTVYQYNVTYTAGSNVSAVGSATGNCKVSATGASAGGTSCSVTLPNITPDTDTTEMRKLLQKAHQNNCFVILGTHSSMNEAFSEEKTKKVLEIVKEISFDFDFYE